MLQRGRPRLSTKHVVGVGLSIQSIMLQTKKRRKKRHPLQVNIEERHKRRHEKMNRSWGSNHDIYMVDRRGKWAQHMHTALVIQHAAAAAMIMAGMLH